MTLVSGCNTIHCIRDACSCFLSHPVCPLCPRWCCSGRWGWTVGQWCPSAEWPWCLCAGRSCSPASAASYPDYAWWRRLNSIQKNAFTCDHALLIRLIIMKLFVYRQNKEWWSKHMPSQFLSIAFTIPVNGIYGK